MTVQSIQETAVSKQMFYPSESEFSRVCFIYVQFLILYWMNHKDAQCVFDLQVQKFFLQNKKVLSNIVSPTFLAGKWLDS